MQKINGKEKAQEDLLFLTMNNNKAINISNLKQILTSDSNHGICGSINLGNTCYMNSSIACLSNCTELTTFFLSKEYKKYLNSSNNHGLKGKLAKAWYHLLKEYWETDKKRGDPSDIKSLVGKKYKKFDTDDQQDANEFIILFLELLGEDLNEIKNKKYIELQEQKNNETDEDCAKRYWEVYLSRNNSIITDLFCGLNKSIIICPVCKYKSITYNPFTSLSLLIPDKKQLIKVKYLNYSKDDIFIFYIPKFSLGRTVKAKIRINKNISLENILLNIVNNLNDFPYEIKDVNFISVVNKVFTKIMKNNEIYNNINKDEMFIFCLEKDIYKNKEMIFIPIYIKIGETFSSYPRGLYLYEGMTYKEIKKKIYLITRKYFNTMIADFKIFDVDRKIKKLLFRNYNKKDEEELIDLINKEYDYILTSKEVEKIFPYQILIQKNIKSKEKVCIFDGKEDNFEFLKKYEIKSNEDDIGLLIYNLKNLNNIIIIKINNESKLYRDITGKTLDTCMVIQSEDYCKKDYLQDNNITLEDCLQLFNVEEHLENGNEWFCKGCKNHVNASKKLEFFYLPKIMCICLSRFKKYGDDYTKNGNFVDFPLKDLNMNKFMTLKDGRNYIYDIFAVSEHYGSSGGGHYTAICKNYDGNWYTYDDSNCSPSSEKEVVTRNAYVLFYRRRDW